MVNFEKWQPTVSSSLTVAGQAISQWTEDIRSHLWYSDGDRKQNSTKPERRKEQRSSNSTAENGNHTVETQHGPSQFPPNFGAGQENGKE